MKEVSPMKIIAADNGVFTIECCMIFRHYNSGGDEVECPHCNTKENFRTLATELLKRRAGICSLNLVGKR